MYSTIGDSAVPVVVRAESQPKKVGRVVKFLLSLVAGGGMMGKGRPEAFAARYVLYTLVPIIQP
jgi:hypothetical protein